MSMPAEEFLRAWHGVVATRFAGASFTDREAVVAELLDRGLAAVAANRRGRRAPSEKDVRLAEQQVVAASGWFDVAAYTSANQRVRAGWSPALEHFCGEGWRSLSNPSPAFDVWWYWSEHLDPAATTVNPLLHFLLDGRFAGHSPLPEVVPPHDVPQSLTRPNRVCLFAGYDVHNVVDDYVVAYVKEMSRHADVYYLFDGYLPADELARLAPYTKGAWAVPHGRYDFGSYSLLAHDLVGWPTIEQYDELVLANDSAYLLRDLDGVFGEMDSRACDWWGMQASKHDYHSYEDDGPTQPLVEAKREMIGQRHMDDVDHLHVSSYLLTFRSRVIGDPGFRRRLDAVVAQPHKSLIIRKYEIGISRYLMCRGFDVDTFIPDLYPFHPLYTSRFFELLERGFPLLKRNLLSENSGHVADLVRWKDRVRSAVPGADVDLFEANLLRVAPDDRLHRSFALSSSERHTDRVHRPWNQWEIAEEDLAAPKFDHWWAFLVDAADHSLTGSLRAVFEEVRSDPTLKKVVLTRSRAVDLDGENVVVLPLESPEGQFLLARSRYVFVRELPGDASYGWFSPGNHDIVHVGGVPLRSFPAPAADTSPGESPYRAVVAGSPAQALAAAQAFAPLPLADVWQTGAPRNDLLLRASADLPDDLRRQEEELTVALAGRPLLLFAPAFDRGGAGPVYRSTDRDVVEALSGWCERHGGVAGYYDDPRDRTRELSRVLEPVGALNLRRLGVTDHVVVDRVATLLLTDVSARAVDFAATGRAIVLLLDATSEDELFHDPGLLPVHVVRDRGDLAAALELPPVDAGDRTRLLFSTLDQGSSGRLVRRIRADYLRGDL
ncbi:hypothetical protein BH10ACT10_BH10ACT10_16690 [soil metagenome]